MRHIPWEDRLNIFINWPNVSNMAGDIFSVGYDKNATDNDTP